MKVYWTAIAALGLIFGLIWVFNHVSAWVSIVLAIIIVGVFINKNILS